MAPLDQLPHRHRQQPVQLLADGLFMALPEYPEVDDSKADEGQEEGKDHALAEHIVGQMSEVACCTQATQNGEHPARKQSS